MVRNSGKKKIKKALDNRNVGGDTDIPANNNNDTISHSTTVWRITTAMTHMSFEHSTLMGMENDVAILTRYGVEYDVEEQIITPTDPTSLG